MIDEEQSRLDGRISPDFLLSDLFLVCFVPCSLNRGEPIIVTDHANGGRQYDLHE